MSKTDTTHRLDERIAAASADGSLTPSEQAVSRFFAEHTHDVAFMSASQIADAAGVGPATVVRTAQTLGYSGLPELKREAQAALFAMSRPARRMAHGLAELGSDPATMLGQLLGSQVHALTEAQESLDPEAFSRAVTLLRKARRIAVLAIGTNRYVAQWFAHSVRITGHSSLAITDRGVAAADELVELRSGDVLVVIAYERIEPTLTVALDHAGELGLQRLLITDTLGLALANRYEVMLTARRGEPNAMPTMVVTLAIVEALHLALAAATQSTSIEASNRLNALRQDLL